MNPDLADINEAAAGGTRPSGSLARTALWLVLVPLVAVMRALEPAIRIIFGVLAVLGLAATVMIGGSGAAPHFPVFTALLVVAGCAVVPALYRAVLHLLQGGR